MIDALIGLLAFGLLGALLLHYAGKINHKLDPQRRVETLKQEAQRDRSNDWERHRGSKF